MSSTSTAATVGAGVSRPVARGSSGRLGDGLFRAAALGAALVVLVLLGAVALSMLWGGLPAFRAFGLPFLYGTDWDPVARVFTAGVAIYGTLVTSAIAMAIAIPVSFGIAVFLTEVAPACMRGPVATAIELLAGCRPSSTACGGCSCSPRSWPTASSPG